MIDIAKEMPSVQNIKGAASLKQSQSLCAKLSVLNATSVEE